MGTYHNAIQRTIVLALAMMGTLLDGTLNTLIGTIHLIFPPLFEFKTSIASQRESIPVNFVNLEIYIPLCYDVI